MRIIKDYNKELSNKIAKCMNEAGSDKHSDHNYSHAYSHFISMLPSTDNINFLEIGIANVEPDKSSLHGWSNIFETGNIYGVDINPEKMINTDRIKTFVIDQGSLIDLSRFRESTNYVKFDIILDDGSHSFSDALTSFQYLINSLKDTGIYMIEDIGKNDGVYGQSVVQWVNYLQTVPNIDWDVINCKPDKSNDDSVIIGVWKI